MLCVAVEHVLICHSEDVRQDISRVKEEGRAPFRHMADVLPAPVAPASLTARTHPAACTDGHQLGSRPT